VLLVLEALQENPAALVLLVLTTMVVPWPGHPRSCGIQLLLPPMLRILFTIVRVAIDLLLADPP
jgi:hypothetical protein